MRAGRLFFFDQAVLRTVLAGAGISNNEYLTLKLDKNIKMCYSNIRYYCAGIPYRPFHMKKTPPPFERECLRAMDGAFTM